MSTPLLRVLPLFIVLAWLWPSHDAASQTAPAAKDAPRTIHTFKLGTPGAPGSLSVETDAHAKAIVDDILKHFGFLTTDAWKIRITDDGQETPYALARYWPNGTREIIFNKDFMKRVTEGSGGKWPAYCIAAHELGHHLRLHLELKPIVLRDFELQADYFCGFLLGKMNSEYDDAVRAMQYVAAAKGYPSHAERVQSIATGWKDATGKGTPGEVNKPAKTGPTPQAPAPVAAAAQADAHKLQNFIQKDNRDIYGFDIELADGKPGIPGVTLSDCAEACDKRKACVAFSFDKWKGWCFLKKQIATSILNPHSVIAVKKPGKLPNASMVVPDIIPLKGRRFHDTPILESREADAPACEAKCTGSIRCVAFSYVKNAKDNNCQLFNGSVGHYADPGADSGYKRQSPPT